MVAGLGVRRNRRIPHAAPAARGERCPSAPLARDWEIGLKAQRGALALGVPFTEYVQRPQRVDSLTLAPVDTRVCLRVLPLQWPQGDPADRVIVATAQLGDLSLVSSDAQIASYYAKTVWE